MYIPESFRISDDETLRAFIDAHDFATLVTAGADGMVATHLPLTTRRAGEGLVLCGHVARANPHWRQFDGQAEALVIFQGPHGYVSPRFYASAPAVPTWNYAVVHAYGAPRVTETAADTEAALTGLLARYEEPRPAPWRLAELPPERRAGLLQGIVAFEVPVTRLEGKFKLNQNRSVEDRAGVVAALEADGSEAAAGLAAIMRRHAL